MIIDIPVGALLIAGASLGVAFPGAETGAAVFAGQVPTIEIAIEGVLDIPAGSLALAGGTVGVAFQGVETGSLALTGLAPTVSIPVNVSIAVPAGVVAFSGTFVSIAFIDPAPGSLVFQGRVLTVSLNTASFDMPAGAVALVGRAPALGIGVGTTTTAIPAGALVATGRAASVLVESGLPVVIGIPSGALSLRGRAGDRIRARGSAATSIRRVSPTLELLVNADTWVDLTDDLVNDPLRWSRGIFGSGPLDLLARPGTLTGTLDNTDTNSVGIPYLYSPGHANCLTGFRHGAIVRLHISDGLNERYVFRGRLKVIDPDPDLYGLQVVRFMAADWLSEFASYDAGQLALREDVRSDELINDLIASLPTQPVNLDIDSGLDEYDFAFDDLGGDMPKATQVAQDILQSERGYLYLRGDDTEGETLRFENRQARAGAEPLFAFGPDHLPHDKSAITVPSDQSQIFNDIEVLTVPREVDDTPVVLVRLSSPVEVGPGRIEQVFVDYQDPENEAEHVGGKDMIDPVAVTDYTANDARDGLGVDMMAQLQVRMVFWGSRCMIELENTDATRSVFVRGPGTDDGLQIRGYGLYRYRPVSSRATNTDSVDQHGARQLPAPLMMPYQEDRNIGQGVADLLAVLYGGLVKVPIQIQPDTFSTDELTEQGILRDIGDPIQVSEVATGVDEALVFIHGVSHELGVDGFLRTTWALCPGDVTDVFILDDPDRGVLDVNVLAYA